MQRAAALLALSGCCLGLPTPPAPPSPSGSSWSVLKKSFSAITVGIAFEDANTGWTSHTDGSSLPQIVKTTDAGETWVPVENNTGLHAMIMGVAAKKGSSGMLHDIATTGLASSEYSLDGDQFKTSVVAILVSQDISYSAGRMVITGPKGPCLASLGGALYSCHKAPFTSQARYSSSPSAQVIYTTGGTWPSQNGVRLGNGLVARADGASHHALSRNVRVVAPQHGGAPRLEVGEETFVAAAPNSTGYVAELFKSADGGKTWTSLFHDEGNFYFNGIDCISETTCIAVGEGFANDGSGSPGARVYMTTDGKEFKLVHTIPASTGGESLMAAKMISATEWWVGGTAKVGGLLTPALALHTTDGGKTYTNEGAHVLGEYIMSWDWLSPGLAFATTVNALQVSSLLRYSNAKPAPPGPPGPSPPAPSGSFEQKVCADANCSSGCQEHAFPVGQCLKVTGGGSAEITQCTSAGLVQKVYQSSDCSGTAQTQTAPVGQCLKASQGGYFENLCGGGAGTTDAAALTLSALVH